MHLQKQIETAIKKAAFFSNIFLVILQPTMQSTSMGMPRLPLNG